MRCGHCKITGPEITVAHVRACKGNHQAVASTAHNLFEQAENYFDEGDEASTDTLVAQSGFSPTGYQHNTWDDIDKLRAKLAKHLVREERGKLIGYYAIQLNGVVKFYRVKKILKGKWKDRVFIDAQASDDYWPVKNPQSLRLVLEGITEDPDAAAKRYADELGCCSRCNRTLTDDESRARGIGPVCWGLVA